MIQNLRAHPFRTALLAFVVYLLVFIVPAIIAALSGRIPLISEATDSPVQAALGQLPLQLGIAALLILVVALLGWRREVGFRRAYPGGLKYTLVPLVLVILALGTFITIPVSEGGRGVLLSGSLTTILGFVLVNLLTGFTEELMFRGILFQGLRARLTPLWTVIVSALLFGSLHFVNLFSGASVENTVPQVIHAAALGIMMGALRLRGGAIVPLMLYHGIWDFLIGDIGVVTLSQGQPAGAATGSGITLSPIEFLPAVYGVFVLWRYYVARRKGKIPAPAAPDTRQNPATSH